MVRFWLLLYPTSALGVSTLRSFQSMVQNKRAGIIVTHSLPELEHETRLILRFAVIEEPQGDIHTVESDTPGATKVYCDITWLPGVVDKDLTCTHFLREYESGDIKELLFLCEQEPDVSQILAGVCTEYSIVHMDLQLLGSRAT